VTVGRTRSRLAGRGLLTLLLAVLLTTSLIAPAVGQDVSSPWHHHTATQTTTSAPVAPTPEATDEDAFTSSGFTVQSLPSNSIDRTRRNTVIESYRWDYLWHLDDIPGIRPRSFGWTGSVSGCKAGDVPASVRTAALRGMNWYRSMAGFPAVTLDPLYNTRAQEAALIMRANNGLSHHPPESWDCWTQTGRTGAENSNLALGQTDLSWVLEGFMDDPGPTNTPVGHRRWQISPGADRFGFGATDRTTAIHVVHGNSDYTGPVEWIAWPMQGFWPLQLPTPRWSLSHTRRNGSSADFGDAEVRMYSKGRRIGLQQYGGDCSYGYLCNITWDITDSRIADYIAESGDTPLDVEVRNIRVWRPSTGTTTETYKYTVTLVDALPPLLTDIESSVFARDIVWMQWKGITRGCNPPANDRFCPGSTVTRGAMAAFLSRALGLPAAPSAGFTDTRGHIFEKDIDRLAAAGITRGCNPPANDRFCPNDPVSRGQMGAFLSRALKLPDAPSAGFVDTRGHLFERDIDRLAAAGITRGCNPPTNDRFCPGDPVTRGAMAAFIRRASP
jgi:hypothetical protein